MAQERWTPEPEWLSESRRAPRWRDVRTAMTHWQHGEYLGKTRDVSLQGLCVALKGACPRVGDPVAVDVVFEAGIRGFRGEIVHVRAQPWGSLVGVRCEEPSEEARRFLEARYGTSPDPLGTVT